MSESYLNVATAGRERPGAPHAFVICKSKADAEVLATHYRKLLFKCRILRRDLRAGGVYAPLWIVTVSEGKP